MGNRKAGSGRGRETGRNSKHMRIREFESTFFALSTLGIWTSFLKLNEFPESFWSGNLLDLDYILERAL